MKKYVRWTTLFLLIGAIGGFVVWQFFGPARPIMSYQGKISRAAAERIAPSYTGGQILLVVRSDRFTTSYLVENKAGSRQFVRVSDGEEASEWQFCTSGDYVTFSVRDFPTGPPAQGDSGRNSVAYYLVPTCSR
ncbi:MAG: hypothetical protein UT43_C0006G0013 [Parcubacteria group bacterium GW2011_GWC1_39_29]|nr:MAG: hypothetical protein UT43_C0006G0013 [Parcubacteria group bacterium GW2011_GWC1_39_29]